MALLEPGRSPARDRVNRLRLEKGRITANALDIRLALARRALQAARQGKEARTYR